jgi:subtilisin family serine protease
MMTTKYYVVLHDGVDKTDFLSLVSSVVNEMLHRPHMFVALCTEAEARLLSFNESVKSVMKYDDNSITEEQAITKTVRYKLNTIGSFPPVGKYGPGTDLTTTFPTGSPYPPKGNWGLMRHTTGALTHNQEQIQVYTSPNYNDVNNNNAPIDLDGTSVDIILNIDSVLDLTDDEFKTLGVTRIQSFQWNTLTDMGSLASVNYSPSPLNLDAHSEAVAYIAVSNTYGWATGANIYVWPRNQLGGFSGLFDNGYDCFRLFHQNKGNSRPTIVVDTLSTIATADAGDENTRQSAIMFRNDIYGEEIAPGGVDPFPLIHWKQYNSIGGSAYGHSTVRHQSGKITFTEGDYDALNLIPADRNEIKARIENIQNYDIYSTRYQPIENMIAAGVHKISSAGNYQTTTTIPGDADFNNGTFEAAGYTLSNIGNYSAFNRTSFHGAGDTIMVGALSSHKIENQTNETFAEFSCRGDRVDCVAAGQNIYLDLKINGFYNATGTSFASPQIAGMAALVLQRYPTTTPRQLRKYFREVAIDSNNTLYTSGNKQLTGSIYGDVAYFQDTAGCRGYSTKIALLPVDANTWAIPTSLSNDPITSSITEEDNKLNFTISEINSKLALT